MTTTQSVLSLEPVGYDVTALVGFGSSGNPTTDVVQFAFTAPGVDPVSGDWKAGSWQTVAGPPQVYVAYCWVGPGGTIALAKGVYDVWIKITDAPGVPVKSVDILKIT